MRKRMKKEIRRIQLQTVLILLSLLSTACTSTMPEKRAGQACFGEKTLKRAVIMPFSNDTMENGIEILTRTSFYNAFSSKNYLDVELMDVDRGLTVLTQNRSLSWMDLAPSTIADFFHADYVIYGSVKDFRRLFLGIYAQISITLNLKVVDADSGNIFWEKVFTKRSHEGGLPFDALSIIPAALRSGLHLKEDKTLALVDRANRELVEQIPEPAIFPVDSYFVDIQVASFTKQDHAEQVLRMFQRQSLNTRIETVTLDDRKWYRIMIGPYYYLPKAHEMRIKIKHETFFEPILVHHYPKAAGWDPDAASQ